MEHRPVNSSSLAAVGYDASTAILQIVFRQGGIYQYYDVPASVYLELMSAESHGRYFVDSIRPVYSSRRID